MSNTAFKRFDHNETRRLSSVGWDAWAEDYAQLPQNNPTYRFSKRLFYDVIDSEFGREKGLDVLDFNCGCGNDFEHLLYAGHRVVHSSPTLTKRIHVHARRPVTRASH